MKYLILSDIHGDYYAAVEVMQRQINLPDAVLFLGDGVSDIEYLKKAYPGVLFYAVRGNCDMFYNSRDALYPAERLIDLEGVKIFMTHGHKYGVKGSLTYAIEAAYNNNADILLFGHTHVPIEKYIPKGEKTGSLILERPLRVFNPGSLGYGKSFGTLTIMHKEILLSHGTLD